MGMGGAERVDKSGSEGSGVGFISLPLATFVEEMEEVRFTSLFLPVF